MKILLFIMLVFPNCYIWTGPQPQKSPETSLSDKCYRECSTQADPHACYAQCVEKGSNKP